MIGRLAAARRAPRRAIAATLSLVLTAVAVTAVVGNCSPDRAAAAASGIGPAEATAPAAASAAPPAAALDATRVLAEIAAAAAGAGGRVAVTVTDPAGVPVITGPDAGTPAYTASLVELFVVAGLLARDAAGAVALGPVDLALMRAALVTSDDDAMSALWVRHDGARLVTETTSGPGLTGTAPPAVPGQWGRATTSAADIAALLSSLDEVRDHADATTMLDWLRATAATAADGFDQAFGLLSGTAAGAGAKQGWMCCVDDGRQLHSAGILADGRVVVLLGQFPRATPWQQASAALDAAAAAVVGGTG